MSTAFAPSRRIEVDRSDCGISSIPVLLCVAATDECATLRSALHELDFSYVQALDIDQVAQVIETTGFDVAIFSFGFAGRCLADLIALIKDIAPGLPFAFWTPDSAPLDEVVTAMRLGAVDIIHGELNGTSLESLVARARSQSDANLMDALGGSTESISSFNSRLASASPPISADKRSYLSVDAIGSGPSEMRSRNGHPPLPLPKAANGRVRLDDRGQDSIAAERKIEDGDALRLILGRSASIEAVRSVIRQVAPTSATVMIHGESGVGKELVAKATHMLSRRADKVFAPVNMAAIPDGLAESFLFGHERGAFTSAINKQKGWCQAADGGTLFLDEIGDLELTIQPKLLRFLQEGSIQTVGGQTVENVDVRLITATNQDPRELVRRGRLREDLFFRLNVIPIYIPPLRERAEDIRELAEIFLGRAAKRHERPVIGFTDDALDVLLRHDWPGNVRQLENMVERLVIFAKGEYVEAMEIPAELHVPARKQFQAAHFSLKSTPNGDDPAASAPLNHGGVSSVLERLSPFQVNERTIIIDALQRADGHVINAALLLGLGQATMYRKIKQYEIPHQRKRRKMAPK